MGLYSRRQRDPSLDRIVRESKADARSEYGSPPAEWHTSAIMLSGVGAAQAAANYGAYFRSPRWRRESGRYVPAYIEMSSIGLYTL